MWEAETWELGRGGVKLGLRNEESIRLESPAGSGCRNPGSRAGAVMEMGLHGETRNDR